MHRQALARQRALVHVRLALEHRAVDRDARAGAHLHFVALPHLGGRDLRPHAAAFDERGLRGQVHQGGDRLAGLALGTGLEVFAEGHEGQDHGGGLIIQIVGGFAEEEPHGHDHAVDQRRAGADRDQGVHVRAAVQEGFEALRIIGKVDDHHGQGQRELDDRTDRSAVQLVRQRQSDHVPHGEIHQNEQERDRNEQAQLHALQRFLLRLVFPRRVLRLLLRAVARRGDRGDDIRRRKARLVVFNFHRAREQVDLRGLHAL